MALPITKTQALEFKALTEKLASAIEDHVRPVKRISDYSNQQLRDILVLSKKYYDAVMQIEGMNIDRAYKLFNASWKQTVENLIADFPEYSKYTPRQVKALALRTALGEKGYTELFERQNEQLNALLEARELLQDQTDAFSMAIGDLGVGLNPIVGPARANGVGEPLKVLSVAEQNSALSSLANIKNQLMPELDAQIERLCTYTFGLYDDVPFEAKALPPLGTPRNNPAFLAYLGYIGLVTVGAFAVSFVCKQIEIDSTALLKQRCKDLQEQEKLLWKTASRAFSDQNNVLKNIIGNSTTESLKLYFAETINFLINLDIKMQPLARDSIQTRFFFEEDCGLNSNEITLVKDIQSFMNACGVPLAKQKSVNEALDKIRKVIRNQPKVLIGTSEIAPLLLNSEDIKAAPTKLIESLRIFQNFSNLTIKLSEEQIKQLSAQIERLKKESINSHVTDMVNSLARNTSTLLDYAVYPMLALGILWGGAKVYKVLKSED